MDQHGHVASSTAPHYEPMAPSPLPPRPVAGKAGWHGGFITFVRKHGMLMARLAGIAVLLGGALASVLLLGIKRDLLPQVGVTWGGSTVLQGGECTSLQETRA